MKCFQYSTATRTNFLPIMRITGKKKKEDEKTVSGADLKTRCSKIIYK